MIDLRGKSSIADHLIIASGRSARQVGALGDYVLDKLKAIGHRGAGVEGKENGDWVLIDAGDLIVHLFRPEVRAYYNLEKMWGAPRFRSPRCQNRISPEFLDALFADRRRTCRTGTGAKPVRGLRQTPIAPARPHRGRGKAENAGTAVESQGSGAPSGGDPARRVCRRPRRDRHGAVECYVAGKLEAWRDQGVGELAFLIGGAAGHGHSIRDTADFLWSLGPATWPHLLVRALVAEQLYRGFAILAGHPYHRA